MSHRGPGNLCSEGEYWSPIHAQAPSVATTEVIADPSNDRRHRRRFSGEYKVRILAQVDACKGRGEVAAILRKESLYSSHLI